ncbi:hypothetical protein IVB69_09980 [Flavobacterium sp. J49]|uniref:hypothetical protein n=1 Tax=Flavobacterium sp. J49 TaxID=2718534 RepID=UPI0015936577|nr:hypothetical protein [Flavobacterium sp. J49]MBF6641806.1 hypothetical protein [Flavobacterium sp. J49]NIC03053.1 hypothetical protein [Flavobacterium sp. J49]
MKANDVFNIAIHLDNDELIKLNNLIQIRLKLNGDRQKNKAFTEQDAIEYLLKTVFNKKR